MGVSVVALSSIPRWRLAIALDVNEVERTSPCLGCALVAFYDPTCEITPGRNALTEHIVNRWPAAGVVRLVLFDSYASAPLPSRKKWLFLRGEISRKKVIAKWRSPG